MPVTFGSLVSGWLKFLTAPLCLLNVQQKKRPNRQGALNSLRVLELLLHVLARGEADWLKRVWLGSVDDTWTKPRLGKRSEGGFGGQEAR